MPLTALPTGHSLRMRAARIGLSLGLLPALGLLLAPAWLLAAPAPSDVAQAGADADEPPAIVANAPDSTRPATPIVASRRALRTQVQPGETPPDFLGLDRAGKPVKVSDYRGKLVVISFWASWCAPCRRELPMLSALQAGVGRDHLQVIAINLNEPKRDFEAFLKLNPDLDLNHIRDTGAVARHYGITAVPNLFVIDQAGRVAQVHRGYSVQKLQQFAREIAALLPADALKRPVGGAPAQ